MKGYVRQRGNKWSYTVDVGRDSITGKRKQATKAGFVSEKEARKAMNEVIYEFNKGIYIDPQKISVKDFALEWIDTHKHNIKDTTAALYHGRIKNWIIPILGNLKVQDVKPVHAQNFAKKLLESCENITAKNTLTLAKMIFKRAVSLKLISESPFNEISIRDKKKHKKKNTWTFDQISHFLSVVKKYEEFYYGLFATTVYTGLRKGEVLGIKKSNINFDKNIIIIDQQIIETKEKGVHSGPVKTPSSERIVTIDPLIASILKEQIQKNNIYKLKLGPEYEDNDLVFCHIDGKMVRPSTINRPFRAYIKRAGVPYIKFHDMRHTHATLLMALNVNPKLVSERLGHSSVTITLDTYSHSTDDLHANVADIFSQHAQNSSRGQSVSK